jgi:hypothetical protein
MFDMRAGLIRSAIGLGIVGAETILACAWCAADEADQYLSWGIELADSASTINAYTNGRIDAMLDVVNRENPDCECETLTNGIFADIYFNRLQANLTSFVETAPAIDIYPARDVTNGGFMAMSIYRDAPLALTIRMTRTVRIGDVYLGVDKLAHFFGIGRRYFAGYRSSVRAGQSEDEAIDTAIRWGIFTENTVLGTTTNGIFSFADLEANYQGFELARNLCAGASPHLGRDGGRWAVIRPLDLREYINPAFDESFNPPFYTGDLRRAVFGVLAKDYALRAELPAVAHRFSLYRTQLRPPSRSTHIIQQYLREQGITSQRAELLSTLGLSEHDPAAPLDPYDLGGSPSKPPGE